MDASVTVAFGAGAAKSQGRLTLFRRPSSVCSWSPVGSFPLLGNLTTEVETIRTRTALVLALALLVLATPVFAHRKYHRGDAVYYADKYAGGGTACGGTYDPTALTAAHRKLPCGSRVRVKNLANGNKVVVTITDRGPYGDQDTIIDVSRRAAKRLGFWGAGRTKVRLVVLEFGPE